MTSGCLLLSELIGILSAVVAIVRSSSYTNGAVCNHAKDSINKIKEQYIHF
jgi:hypothetical protein